MKDAYNGCREDLLMWKMEAQAAQTQLAERDKTILEQQARMLKLQSTLQKQSIGGVPLIFDTNTSTLEAALKAERIKTLEDAAGECFSREQAIECYHRLHEMANELKEQS